MKKKVVLTVAVVLLVVMVAAMCVACTPSQKSVINKFTKRDYKLTIGDENSSVVTLAKSLTVSITITWYDNGDDAKDAYDIAVKAPLQSEKTVKRKGNAVAIGDEASIKIF